MGKDLSVTESCSMFARCKICQLTEVYQKLEKSALKRLKFRHKWKQRQAQKTEPDAIMRNVWFCNAKLGKTGCKRFSNNFFKIYFVFASFLKRWKKTAKPNLIKIVYTKCFCILCQDPLTNATDYMPDFFWKPSLSDLKLCSTLVYFI